MELMQYQPNSESSIRNCLIDRPATPAPWFDNSNKFTYGDPSISSQLSSFGDKPAAFNKVVSKQSDRSLYTNEGSAAQWASSKLDPNSKPFSPRSRGNGTMDAFTGNTSSFSSSQKSICIIGEIDCKDESSNRTDKNLRKIKTTMSPGMIDDYGMKGLLGSIEKSSKYYGSPFSTILSLQDLGIGPEGKKPFETPFSSYQLEVFNDFFYVPDEYMHSNTLGDKLPLPYSQYWGTDLLFFLFYTAVGEALQVIAGYSLFDRGWRFNKITRTWLARLPNTQPEEKSRDYEVGVYQYFDVETWSRLSGRFTLFYRELCERIGLAEEVKGVYSDYHSNQQVLQAQTAQKRRELAKAAFLRSLKPNQLRSNF